MRCYRVRGKGVRGLYQKTAVQGNGEKPPHLSLSEASSLCWLQLWYTLYKHSLVLLSPEKLTWKTSHFPSLASQFCPPQHSMDHSLVTSAHGHSQWVAVKQRFWCVLVHSKPISWWQITLLLCWYPKLILSSRLKESTCVGLRHWAHSCQKVWQDILTCQEISVRL